MVRLIALYCFYQHSTFIYKMTKGRMMAYTPSHLPGSDVPQDSHLPNSSGRPRKGFAS